VRLTPRLPALDESSVDSLFKGYPGTSPPIALGEVGRQGWYLARGDVPFPVAVLRASSLAHNRAAMQRYLAATGARLSPHGKTTMSPQLFALQLADGAFAITCATVCQLQVYRRFGIRRVLMANQVVGRRALEYVTAELARDPDFQLYLIVDSVEGVRRLDAAARARGLARPVRVLLEVGVAGGRTGVRDLDAAQALIDAIVATGDRVALCGVEAFEDVVDAPLAERPAVIERLLSFALEVGALARRAAPGAEPFLLSAGGSGYFDLATRILGGGAARLGATVVLRSGCYLTHDHGAYAAHQEARRARSPGCYGNTEFRPALEVWAEVQSRPEHGRAYLNAGKRDLSFDLDLPRPVAWLRPGEHAHPVPLDARHRVVRLNDQHAHLALPPESSLDVGDLVVLGISHPCTTFDRWQLLYVVDDDDAIVDAIRTFF
jgi:D-serine dehydratase